jgi:nucleoside-diphosphate-sugar epimerase
LKKIAVSGASGFVGTAMVDRLVGAGHAVEAFVRNPVSVDGWGRGIGVTSILDPDGWQRGLSGCTAFVHCAARAHVTSGPARQAAEAFREANVRLTLALAREAARSGVRRFVFVSSIGVHGASSHGSPFRPDDQPAPLTPYAVSKLEAEQGLREVARETGLEVVVVRPPLVYGPNAPGNFGSLVRMVGRGWPLPLAGATENRRSFIAIDNLVDLLMSSAVHPAAANRIILASDGEDLSTAELVRRIGKAMRKSPRMFPVPKVVMKLALSVAGRPDAYESLFESLQVDISETRQLLGWTPVVSVDKGLARAVSR